MAEFQLTPPPSVLDEKPPASRVTEWHEMQGKTIRSVVRYPTGKKRGHKTGAVIVFEDDCWAVLLPSGGGDDDASMDLTEHFGSPATYAPITDYLCAQELLGAGLLNEAQCDYLLQQQADAERQANAKRAAALRAQADKLEADGKAA